MMHTFEDKIYISTYHPNGKAKKFILIIPNEKKIVFKDHETNLPYDAIPFSAVLTPDFHDLLKTFMGSTFHIEPDTIYEELHKFITQLDKIQSLAKFM